MKSTRILFVGSGSGGHVYPLFAVANEIERLAIDQQFFLKLYYAGPRDRFRESAIKNGFQFVHIAAGKIRRYGSIANILDIPKFFISIIQAFVQLFLIMPDVVFSKGGAAALPVVFAAWWYRIPVIIHESDAVPGIANLFSARFATRVAVGFKEAASFFKEEKTLVTGNPVRAELLANIPDAQTARKRAELHPQTPTVLVIGGSLGSVRINEFVVNHLQDLLPRMQILHQFGITDFPSQEKNAKEALAAIPESVKKEHPYVITKYFETEADVQNAYAAADIVVSRAGASSIFEIAAFRKPAILIPLLESANDHQRINAYAYAQKTGSAVIEEGNLLPTIFLGEVEKLLKDSVRTAAIAKASWEFFKPDAAVVIAKEILRLARLL